MTGYCDYCGSCCDRVQATGDWRICSGCLAQVSPGAPPYWGAFDPPPPAPMRVRLIAAGVYLVAILTIGRFLGWW